LGHCVALFFSLLHFEGDADADIVFEGRVIVFDEPSVLKEAGISESEYFGALFLLLLDFDIFARPHGKKNQ
jgi:hypothetical protein